MVIRLKLYHLLIVAVFVIIIALLTTTYIPHAAQVDTTPSPEPTPTLLVSPTFDDLPLEIEEYYFFWAPSLEYSTGNP